MTHAERYSNCIRTTNGPLRARLYSPPASDGRWQLSPNRKDGGPGAGDDLMRSCPGRMCARTWMLLGRPYSKHDQIGFLFASNVQDFIRRIAKLNHRFWLKPQSRSFRDHLFQTS